MQDPGKLYSIFWVSSFSHRENWEIFLCICRNEGVRDCEKHLLVCYLSNHGNTHKKRYLSEKKTHFHRTRNVEVFKIYVRWEDDEKSNCEKVNHIVRRRFLQKLLVVDFSLLFQSTFIVAKHFCKTTPRDVCEFVVSSRSSWMMMDA